MSEASHFRGFDFTGTDWGDTNRAIAARIGADESLVAAARRYFGMVVRERVNWSDGIDWSLSNKELAQKYGVSESTVSRQRGLLGMGFGQIDWNEADWNLTDREIAARLGCTAMAVGKARRRITGQSSRQRGRPKKAERATCVLKVTLELSTMKKLEDLANRMGLPVEKMAEWILASADYQMCLEERARLDAEYARMFAYADCKKNVESPGFLAQEKS